jgi:hypothetical protein
MKFVGAIGAVLLASAMAACSGSSLSLGETPTVSGKLEGYSGGAKVLKVLRGPGGQEVAGATGSLNADGTFTVTLPGSASLTLTPFAVGSNCAATVNPADAKSASVSVGVYDSAASTTPIGTLFQGDSRTPTPTNGTISGVIRIYVDKNVTVKGTCTSPNTSYDLDLKAGWNAVLVKVTYTNGSATKQEVLSAAGSFSWRLDTGNSGNLFNLR